jgi:hypothetical protein
MQGKRLGHIRAHRYSRRQSRGVKSTKFSLNFYLAFINLKVFASKWALVRPSLRCVLSLALLTRSSKDRCKLIEKMACYNFDESIETISEDESDGQLCSQWKRHIDKKIFITFIKEGMLNVPVWLNHHPHVQFYLQSRHTATSRNLFPSPDNKWYRPAFKWRTDI